MSVPSKGGHTDISVLMHNLQHTLVIPQQAGTVAGLRVDWLMAKYDYSLPGFPGSCTLSAEPAQLSLTEPSSKLHKSPFCHWHPSWTCGVVFILDIEMFQEGDQKCPALSNTVICQAAGEPLQNKPSILNIIQLADLSHYRNSHQTTILLALLTYRYVQISHCS